MKFQDFGLHPKVQAGTTAAGYSHPTPIQDQAIPLAMSGRDLLGLAQTGTGKTAAFVLPLLHRLMDGPRKRLRALIVAPTRELAEQIHAEIGLLGRSTGLRSATVYGGVGKGPQLAAFRAGTEIIVACPGRLLDHLAERAVRLDSLEVLVLDEADHMFDMGFLPSIRRIMKHVPNDTQRLLFSATMPDELRNLASGVLRNPATVEVGRVAPAETVEHALYPVASEQKTALLKHILKRDDARSALVFTRTKHGAKRLAQQLDRENFFVTALQGNLSQNKRQQALDGFRNGQFHVLVATDIAARGIDVSQVTHVINYDVPSTGDAYTHRIGRTGRASRSGRAFTFVTADDDKAVRVIERELGMKLERLQIDGFEYQAQERSSVNRDNDSGRRGQHAGGRGRVQGGRAQGQGRSNGQGERRQQQGGRSHEGQHERGNGQGGGAQRRRGNRQRGRHAGAAGND